MKNFIFATVLTTSIVAAAGPLPNVQPGMVFTEGTPQRVEVYPQSNGNTEVNFAIPRDFVRNASGHIIGIKGITNPQIIWDMFRTVIRP